MNWDRLTTVEEMEAATNALLENGKKVGADSWQQRVKNQTPHCGFGEAGTCCRICSMGPCRITPKSPRGICGCDVHGIVARNFLRFVAGGAATHYFTEYSKVSDAGSYIKGSIYEFIESSEKTVIVVDCENSDPYKLCATLKNLDHKYTQKIASIILFDDVHTASAWRILDSFTAIHVEHMMIERVKQSKSLVDVMLIARTCQEHYKNNVDSFILVSSDSDYWGLISSLPEARFLVMIERENCGPDLKNALLNAGIFYCYIDDFYSGNAEDIKLGALFKEIERYIDQTVRLNINEMFSAALKATRIEMSLSEKKQFIAKYLKTMQMEITDDGDVVLQLKRK